MLLLFILLLFCVSQLTITDFHVRCNVVSRYAITTVQTTVVNDNLGAREAIFDVNLPNTAFISNFTLTVDNKEYVANVDEKERAQKIYTEAKRRGKTTAHVATRSV
uniref:VIT domain-containing protein n=1 Tax=Callorhinchus milii TaxID=7868 RepID=A0A4W3GNU6_CALMI